LRGRLGRGEHRLLGAHCLQISLEVLVVLTDASMTGRTDSAPRFGTHSPHGYLRNLPLRQAELGTDLLLVATESIK
jgi:hypothetical protein